MTKRNQLIDALKDGVTTSIEQIESGLKCGCICPSCGEPLAAKKGAKRMHHFSHYSGHNCEYGYETSLHKYPDQLSIGLYSMPPQRSKMVTVLADLGYTNIYEFGGINTWPYETES